MTGGVYPSPVFLLLNILYGSLYEEIMLIVEQFEAIFIDISEI